MSDEFASASSIPSPTTFGSEFIGRDSGSAYGANYDRLVALKNRYDPTNFFRMKQNVKPTA